MCPITSSTSQTPKSKRRHAAQDKPTRRKSGWRDLKAWHWVSSAACLVATLLFALTGITLNHAHQLEASPSTTVIEQQLPTAVVQAMQARQQQLLEGSYSAEGPLPAVFRGWYLSSQQQSLPAEKAAQWDEFEAYFGLPRAGGDLWFRVDLETGMFYQESIDRGWIAYFNDLHKGRNTGWGWITMLDILAIVMLVFSVSGLLLLKRYAKGRKSTWWWVALGVVVPWLALLVPAHAAQAASPKQMLLQVEIPQLDVAEYHRPYVAIWLADAKHQRVADLAVWYDGKLANKEGEKWLKDMRQWWRRSGRMATMPIDGVTGATRRPGSHNLNLSQFLPQLAELPPGEYRLNIEAAREVGGREHLQLPITLPLQAPVSAQVQGQHELGLIKLSVTAQ